jgi:hypothetical protein
MPLAGFAVPGIDCVNTMYTRSPLYIARVHVSRHFHPYNAISFDLFEQQHQKRHLSCFPVLHPRRVCTSLLKSVPQHVDIDACHHTKVRKQPPNSPPCSNAMQSFLVPWFRNNNSWSHDSFYFTTRLSMGGISFVVVAGHDDDHIRPATSHDPNSQTQSSECGLLSSLPMRCYHGPGGPSVANRSLLRAAKDLSCYLSDTGWGCGSHRGRTSEVGSYQLG